MAKYLSNRQKNLKIGIVSYTESNTVLEVTGKVGIGTTNAQQQSLYVVGDGYFSGDLRVSGVATYGSNTITIDGDNNTITVGSGVTISSDEGITTPQLNISGTLFAQNINVGGASTLASNGGITTTGGDLYVGRDAYIAQNFVASGIATVGSLSIGSTQVISSARQLQNIASLDSTTTATIEAAIANAPNTFSDLNVTGISTLGVTSATNLTAQQLNVSGVSTFAGITTVTGTTLFAKQLNVSGVSTLAGKIVSGNGIGNTNLANTLNYSASTGITAFRPISLVDSAAGIKISRTGGQTLGAALELQTWDVGIVTNYSYWDVNAQSGYFGIRDIKNSRSRIFIDDSGSILLGATSSNFTTNYNQLVGVGTDKLLNVLGNSYISGSVGIGSTTPTSKLSVVGDGNFTGVVTATTFIGNLTGIAASATQLVTPRTFEITGDVVASPISFDGTGNVSLAATIQPNSVGLGTDTFGDYVRDITGTANQITVTSGTGEGSSPTLSIPSQFTAPQDVTVTRDLQVDRNLSVTGNITIGGTSATLFTETLKVSDSDIILGFRTDGSGNDVSNDTTANHGGIAVASTEGSPLVRLVAAGIETLPPTYKKIMWFKAGSFAGLGTDAWLFNYAVGIGSTQFPTGTRLAAGSVQFSERDLAVVRNINASGVVTATTFVGALTGTATSTTNIPNLSGDVSSNNTVTTLATVNSNIGTFGDTGAIPSITVNAKGLVTGVTTVAPNNGQLSLDVSGIGLTGSATFTANQSGSSTFTVTSNATDANTPSTIVARDASGNFSATTITANLTGTATTATNLADAANITTGTINSARLSGTYNINVSYANTAGIATVAQGLTGTPNITVGVVTATRGNFSGIITSSGAVISGVTTSNGFNATTGNDYKINGTSVLTSTTLGSGVVNSSLTSVGTLTNLNVGNINSTGIITATSGNFSGIITSSGANISGVSTILVNSTASALRITQLGSGNALVVEDSTNPDATPFVVNADGSVGIGTTRPTSKLSVAGDGNFTGVVTASSFSGNASSATFATTAGIATFATSSGIATFATNAGIATFATSSGIATFATNAGIATFATSSGIATYADNAGIATFATTAGVSTSVSGGTASVTELNVSGFSTISVNTFIDALRITQLGTGNALVVEDSTNPDASPFVVNASGSVGIGITNPESQLHLYSTSGDTKLIIESDGDNNNEGDNAFIIFRQDGGSEQAAIWNGNWTGSNDNQLILANAAGGVGGGIIFATGSGSGYTTADEAMRITPSRNVGIGTINPTSKLHVFGDGNFTGVVTASSFSGNASSATFATTAGIATFATTAGIATFATNAGIATFATTAGIATFATSSGIATFATSSGIATFATTAGVSTSVSGGTASVTQLNVSGVSTIGVNTSSNALRITQLGSGNALVVEDETNPDATPFVVNASGQVGIGTTNPARALDVQGSIYIRDTTGNSTFTGPGNIAIKDTTDDGFISFHEGDGTRSAYIQSSDTNGFLVNQESSLPLFIRTEQSQPIVFETTNIERIRIQPTGNVGIGTTNPTSKLSVAGDGNFTGVVTASSFSGNASSATFATNAGIATFATTAGIATFATSSGIATYADNAGIATFATSSGIATYADNAGISTNLKGGLVGNIPYQSATDTTVFLANGSSGTILQSNGVGNAPSWITAAPADAITGLTVRDEGTIVGGANSVSQLNFVGSNVSVASTAGIATITIADNLVGTALSISGISTFNNTLNVVPTATSIAGLFSGTTSSDMVRITQLGTGNALVVEDSTNPDASPFVVNASGNVGVGTTNPTSKLQVDGNVLVSGVSTFAGDGTVSGPALFAQRDSGNNAGIKLYGTSGGNFVYSESTSSNPKALIIDSSQSENILFRIAGSTKTLIQPTGEVLIGSGTSTGTANQKLQVTGGAYVSENIGIGTTNPTSKLSVIGDGRFTGVVTATTFFGALTGTATTASSVTANSVGLGTDTYGDYVKDITGTANQITVTSGTGEGSTPTLSIPSQFTAPQDVTVTRDLQVNRNLNVNGNITIGGTSATLFTETLKISDSDIILGFRTDGSGNDVSNDTTANHGGIAVASTEGNPLVRLVAAGIETLPPTYKKIMWFKAETFAGLGTDAWLFNYAVGIGSTQVPNGVRLAAGGMQVTDSTISSPQLNISGVSTFTGNVSFGTSAFFGNDDKIILGDGRNLEIFSGGSNSIIDQVGTGDLILRTTSLGDDIILRAKDDVFIQVAESENAITCNSDGAVELYYDNTKEFETTGYGATVYGVLQSQGLQVSGGSTFSGITTHTEPLFGTQASFTGVVTASSFSGNASSATFATTAGIATFATNAGVSTSVIGGIGSITQLSVSGITTTGTLNVGTGGTIITTTADGLIGINTTNPQSTLDVRGTISIGRTDASTVNSIRSVTDINSWEYAGVSLAVGGQDTSPQDIYFKDDGTKMFMLGSTGDDVNEYALSTAWEVNTATFTTNFLVSSQETAPFGLYFKPDGTRMYICGNTAVSPANADQVRSYTLSNPWDISAGVTYDSKAYTVSDTAPQGVYFKDDGLKMYVVGSIGDAVYEYSLSIAWELDSTITLLNTVLLGTANTLNLPLTLTGPTGIDFNASGTKMYITDSTRDVVARFDLSTPWDTTTTTFYDNLYVGFQELTPNGVFYQEDQAKAYIVGSSSDTVFQYNTEVPSLELASSGITTRSSVVINNEARLNNRLYVTGDTHISSNTNLKGTLTVDGASTLTGNVTASGTLAVTSTLTASAAVTFDATTNNINQGTSQTTGNFTIGGTTTATGTITVGRGTTTQTTNIQAGATVSGQQKTINLGTGGLAGSRTLITVGSATAGAISTVTIPSPTNLLIGTATTTGTASQQLQVNSGAYVSGDVGIGTTRPTSKLSVVGDGNFTGVVTATSFSGSGTNLTGIVTSIVAGTNITVSGSTGQVTINSTATGGSSTPLDILEVMLFA